MEHCLYLLLSQSLKDMVVVTVVAVTVVTVVTDRGAHDVRDDHDGAHGLAPQRPPEAEAELSLVAAGIRAVEAECRLPACCCGYVG
jgi:hypothetical protein